MAITTGDLQDLLQLSQDTLYFVGADFQLGNTSVGSSATLGFNNTAGDLQLVGVATGNATAWLPAAGGTCRPVLPRPELVLLSLKSMLL